MTAGSTAPAWISLFLAAAGLGSGCRAGPGLPRIELARDGRGFALAGTARPFAPWGFNYDHDRSGRLIEDYWESEWPKVEEDFREMKDLGANVVRIHLQVGKLLRSRDEADKRALERLARLTALAEDLGLYLDLTGLGCYRKVDVPAWYDLLGEEERWEVQARFWKAVAKTCAPSPAVFCYDLMNEPVVPGGLRAPGDWLGPPFGEGGYHYVQVITLDQANRPRHEIARRWIERLAAAVRDEDPGRLITVGLVDWSLDRPGLTSGFVPERIAAALDFLSVHVYPEAGRIEQAVETLRGFSVGKPLVVEEFFPLKCSAEDLERWLADSRDVASGWIGFYWGMTPEECRRSGELVDALILAWLELFQRLAPAMTSGR